MRQQAELEQSIDGFARPAVIEQEIDLLCSAVLANGRGPEFLNYLDSISVRHVCPPGTPNEVLQFREGTRWLVAVIRKRIMNGKNLEAGLAQQRDTAKPGQLVS